MVPGSRSSEGPEIPDEVVALAQQVMGLPRHLGIHSAGMVLTREPVGRICPIEPARMPGRTVLQWDKEDCAWMGLVKFDLLGLGMLSALSTSFNLIAQHCGRSWALASIPRNEPGVYDMLCRGDSIGVFQVESRAQIGTLPRLKPRCFYDLAVEIGLIRPGPVQGGAVHPYIRRRTGVEPITYPHPLLKPVLERTLGIPLFQEQLMQMATTVGNCMAADADLLRRAMGSKRGVERIDSLRAKLFEGMAANGIDDDTAQDIYARIESFANFGFAESHALSFAGLVYTSAWVKLHYPAAFLAALLRSQPMGFYSPATLVADARRHGVVTRRPDLTKSSVGADLEALDRGGDDVMTWRQGWTTVFMTTTSPRSVLLTPIVMTVTIVGILTSRCGWAFLTSPVSVPRQPLGSLRSGNANPSPASTTSLGALNWARKRWRPLPWLVSSTISWGQDGALCGRSVRSTV